MMTSRNRVVRIAENHNCQNHHTHAKRHGRFRGGWRIPPLSRDCSSRSAGQYRENQHDWETEDWSQCDLERGPTPIDHNAPRPQDAHDESPPPIASSRLREELSERSLAEALKHAVHRIYQIP